MAAALHFLEQRRLINTDGIDDGGVVTFYVSGGSTLAPIYSDASLTTPLANPVTVPAGAEIPTIYLDDTITYRRRIEYSDGSEQDIDPYLPFVGTGGGGATVEVAFDTRTALKAETPTNLDYAFLAEGDRKGSFVFNTSDLSTEVAADSYEGIYIAPTSDPTGASGAWVRQHADYVTPEMLGWTSTTTASETRNLIQAALDLARRENIIYRDYAQRTLRGTITIPTAISMEMNDTQLWTFEADTVSTDYEEVLFNNGGVLGGTGNYVAVDTKIANGTRIFGSFDLRALDTSGNAVSQLDSVTRAGMASNLVAFSPSSGGEGNGAECIVDRLYMSGFGYGWYQGDWNGGGGLTKALGFTRTNIRIAHFQTCLVPFQSGNSGNGFDDMVVGIMRVSRCGNMEINSSDMTIDSFYWAGLVFNKSGSDAEAQTISGTTGSNVLTVSDAGHNIVVGSYLALLEGAHNKAGESMGCVYEVSAVSGTSVTITENLQEDITDLEFGLDPPYLELSGGATLNVRHMYFEHSLMGIHVGSGCNFISEDVKLGGGDSCFFHGIPVWTIGSSSLITLKMHPVGANNRNALSIVGFVPLSRLGVDSQATIKVFTPGSRAESTTRCDLITCVAPPGFVNVGFFTDESADVNFSGVNAAAEFGDGTYRLRTIGRVSDTSGSNDGTIMFQEGKQNIQGKSAAGSGVAVVVLEDNEMPAVYSMTEVDLITTNGGQRGKVTIIRQTAAPIIAGSTEVGGAWSINGSNQLVWTPSIAGTQNFIIRRERLY